jgi:hypothetical protein
MAGEVCAAHEIMYDTLTHLRDNQSDMYDLLRQSQGKSEETTLGLAVMKATTETGFQRIEARQAGLDAGMLRIEKLLSSRIRTRWSPGKIVALVSAIIGPSGVAVYFALVKGIVKIG